MIRKHKTYSRPRKPFDKKRIEEEAEIQKRFGLKNKREIWKAESEIGIIRRRAKALITADEERKKHFFEGLQKKGFNVKGISDALGLTKEDLLKRRLQTLVFEKKLATTPKAARQLIVHRNVLVDHKVVNAPSTLIPISLEHKISLKIRKMKTPKVKTEGEEM
jgi:small subunit ribosomal protein S4